MPVTTTSFSPGMSSCAGGSSWVGAAWPAGVPGAGSVAGPSSGWLVVVAEPAVPWPVAEPVCAKAGRASAKAQIAVAEAPHFSSLPMSRLVSSRVIAVDAMAMSEPLPHRAAVTSRASNPNGLGPHRLLSKR